VTPYYAVKCNPDPTLLRWLYRRGAAFDCASAREMFMVKEHFGGQTLGDQVLFANPCKTLNDIAVAKDLRIGWVTADSTEELVKMDQAGYRPEVLLRVAVDDSGSACPFGAKFGLAPEEVEEVAKAAQSFHIPVVGISFHVGSGSSDPKAYKNAIYSVKDIWTSLQKKSIVGMMKCLDIGGGWSHEPKLFAEQAKQANYGLVYGPFPRQTIAEPGRFFAAPTHDLYVKVVGKKPRHGGGWRYTIDESIYGQFSCVPFDHANPRIARVRLGDEEADASRTVTPATIFGRTCDSLDWIANSPAMEELHVGDWLYIPNMGAYTTATSTEFNGFPKPEVFETHDMPKEYELSWLHGLDYPLSRMLSVAGAAEAAEAAGAAGAAKGAGVAKAPVPQKPYPAAHALEYREKLSTAEWADMLQRQDGI
jgi:ornithine decarboxylase